MLSPDAHTHNDGQAQDCCVVRLEAGGRRHA